MEAPVQPKTSASKRMAEPKPKELPPPPPIVIPDRALRVLRTGESGQVEEEDVDDSFFDVTAAEVKAMLGAAKKLQWVPPSIRTRSLPPLSVFREAPNIMISNIMFRPPRLFSFGVADPAAAARLGIARSLSAAYCRHRAPSEAPLLTAFSRKRIQAEKDARYQVCRIRIYLPDRFVLQV